MSHPALALITPFSMLTQLASEKDKRKHEFMLAELRAGVLKDMVEAVINYRVDAVKQHCTAILSIYAEQSLGYMAEQKETSKDMRACDDPLERTELKARLGEIDKNLENIRADCLALAQLMGNLLVAIGGNLNLSEHVARALALPEN